MRFANILLSSENVSCALIELTGWNLPAVKEGGFLFNSLKGKGKKSNPNLGKIH